MKSGAKFLFRKRKKEKKKNRVLSQAVNVRSEPRTHADLSSVSLS